MRGPWSVGAATVAVALTMSLVLGASTSAAAAPRAPLVDAPANGALASTAPPDSSGITFEAFRSYGLPIVPGQSFFLSVRRSVPAGPMHFAERVGDADVFIGDANWQPSGSVNGVQLYSAIWLIETAIAGSHTYLAVFEATDQFDALTLSLDLVIQPATIGIAVYASANPIQAHHQVILSPQIEGGTGVEMTGQYEWRNPNTGALIATRPADDPHLRIATLPVGVHQFTVTYLGDPTRAPATSPAYELTVVADIVEASGVGPQYTTFYPVRDTYRDTVALKGNRAEPISVGIRVLSPTGALVRRYVVARGTGAYSVVWNGRNSAGTILAAGTYKVVQTLTDAFGTKKAVTSNVTLSRKKLVQYTKYVTKYGSALTARGSASGGSVTVSSTGGYAKLAAGSGWAIGGWEFYIPAATVYNSVSVQVYSKARLSAPPTYIGIQNFASCPRVGGTWFDTCFTRWASVGNAANSLAWYGTSGTASSAYRSGRYVRGIVVVEYGTVYVYKARARIVYQVLE